jgi:hypothetical protein
MRTIITPKTEKNNVRDNFRNEIYEMIKVTIGANYVLGIPRAFVKYTGTLEAGLLLSQLIHWTPRARRKDGFIYKSFPEWYEEIFLSAHKIKKAAELLKDKGVLDMKKEMANGSETWHYRLDTERFKDSFQEFLMTEGFLDIGQEIRELAVEVLPSANHLIAPRPGSGIEASLRKLIQNIPASKAEDDSLLRLCEFVNDGTYTPDDIGRCAEWILKNFDLIAVTPSAIEKRMPTFLAKQKAGLLNKPRYETSAQRTERIYAQRNNEHLVREATILREQSPYKSKFKPL